jgi:pseudaminic acid biosynthesis-associated methylase
MAYKTEQERFWAETYATDYIKKNSDFDAVGGVDAWQKMLSKTHGIESILECGCNIGRNLKFLNEVNPAASKSIIEISKPAFDFVTSTMEIQNSFNGSIIESDLKPHSFDLTFTIGVLIHIHPDNLIANMRKIFDYSKKYILMGEYFNRVPMMIEYQGQKDKLFKCDFGKLFIENFNVSIVDYGFLWGHLYDKAGFDDITWWLFEKK